MAPIDCMDATTPTRTNSRGSRETAAREIGDDDWEIRPEGEYRQEKG